MGILEKIDMLNLTEEEKVKAKSKFLVTMALVTDEEFKDTVNYLESQGVRITKAREMKVVANPKDEIAKKFSILDEIHEIDIYRQNPTMINRNVIDIYKKIKYCIQLGKSYKREDGTYEPFLFNESLWQQTFNQEENVVEDKEVVQEEVSAVEETTTLGSPLEEVFSFGEEETADLDHMDITEYMKATDDAAKIEAQTTDFATVRKELEASLAELDSLRSLGDESFEEISFSDIEPESYGMGIAA